MIDYLSKGLKPYKSAMKSCRIFLTLNMVKNYPSKPRNDQIFDESLELKIQPKVGLLAKKNLQNNFLKVWEIVKNYPSIPPKWENFLIENLDFQDYLPTFGAENGTISRTFKFKQNI